MTIRHFAVEDKFIFLSVNSRHVSPVGSTKKSFVTNLQATQSEVIG